MKVGHNKIAALFTSLLLTLMCIIPGTAEAVSQIIPEHNTASSSRTTWYVVSETASPGSDVLVYSCTQPHCPQSDKRCRNHRILAYPDHRHIFDLPGI